MPAVVVLSFWLCLVGVLIMSWLRAKNKQNYDTFAGVFLLSLFAGLIVPCVGDAYLVSRTRSNTLTKTAYLRAVKDYYTNPELLGDRIVKAYSNNENYWEVW